MSRRYALIFREYFPARSIKDLKHGERICFSPVNMNDPVFSRRVWINKHVVGSHRLMNRQGSKISVLVELQEHHFRIGPEASRMADCNIPAVGDLSYRMTMFMIGISIVPRP